MLLQGHGTESAQSDVETSPMKSGTGVSAVGESWASEFQRRDTESEPSLLGSTMQQGTESETAVSVFKPKPKTE